MLKNGTRSGLKTAKRSVTQQGSVRFLNLHEYQSKDILKEYGCRVGMGFCVTSPTEAREKAAQIPGGKWVVKSQVLAGGRGKGWFDTGFQGGVHLVEGLDECESMAEKMLGNTLYTVQCNEKQGGRPVRKVLVEQVLDYTDEYYLCFVLDRETQGAAMIGSPCGGVNIEQVAHETPEKLLKLAIPEKEMPDATARQMAEFLGFEGAGVDNAVENITGLYRLFKEKDCTQIEINPFVKAADGGALLLDAKLNFDDSAHFRHQDIFALQDTEQEDQREVEAHKWDLNYVGLDGSIGCLVNGAGLAMATMDIIKLYGGEPANFLDVGGGATTKQVTEAFKLITKDPEVKGIFVNIFGGIMKCDTIAYGVVAAAQAIDLQALGIPLVVRLSGTNAELGRLILDDCELDIVSAEDMDDGAQKIVNAIKAAEKSSS